MTDETGDQPTRSPKRRIALHFTAWAVIYQALFLASVTTGVAQDFNIEPRMGDERDYTGIIIGDLVGALGAPIVTSAILLRWGMKNGFTIRFFVTTTLLGFSIFILNPTMYADDALPLFLLASLLFPILTQALALAFDHNPKRLAPLLATYALLAVIFAIIRPYETWFSMLIEILPKQ